MGMGISPAVLRSFRFERQGLAVLDSSGSPGGVLGRAGWARSVGGCNPYLTLHARGGFGRAVVDAAVAALDLHELPAARGCTYVVPREDYALALTVGRGFGDEAAVGTAMRYLGVTEAELERLAAAVVEALAEGPLEPRALKDALGGAVRNLGEEGRKRGMTTTLPLALGRLQTAGRIRRIPVDGRLDQQRYRYALWSPSPLAGGSLDRGQAMRTLARRYWDWIGPASLANFQWFSGLGVRAAKEAVAALDLQPVEGEGDLLATPECLDALRAHRPPVEPRFALVTALDGLFLLRRETRSLLDGADRNRQGAGERGCVMLTGSDDLPNHAILDRGRIVGLWEYDPHAAEIVAVPFIPMCESLRAAIDCTERFIREEIGDARSFSLDSPESRRPRIQALRELALA